MSKTRKLLSVIVALAMVLSVFAVTASAYGYEAEDAEYTQAWALSEPVDNGDGTFSVDVSLTTNYATGAIQFVVTNTDNTVAVLTGVTVGSAIPETYGATASYSNKTGKVMIIPDSSSDNTIVASAINGVIATLTYTYSGEGSADIAIKNDPKSETNVAGSLIAARMDNGDLVTGEMITGQTVTSTGETRTITASAAIAAPTLAVIDGMNGVINTDYTEYGTDFNECTGFIYGVEPEEYQAIEDVFEVVGDGYMSIVPSAMESECGTGTIVEVYDNDDNLVETYVLIIFGDIDGSGDITADDASYIEQHDIFEYTENGADGIIEAPELLFAGDVDGSYDVTADDASYIELHDGFEYAENDAEGRIYQSMIIDLL